MAGPNTVTQYSFSTGIVSPGIRTRKDWNRIDGAVSDLHNGTVGPTGAAKKRPGIRYLNDCLSHTKPITLVSFEFSKEQVYLLEFGDYQMRFYNDRGMILNNDGTPYVLTTPYSAEDAQEFSQAQEKDAMFFAIWTKSLKQLVRYAHNNWVWSDVFTDTSTARLPSPSSVYFYSESTEGHNNYEYMVTTYRTVSGTPQESVGGPTILSNPNTIDFIAERPQNNVLSCASWIAKYKTGYGKIAGFPTMPDGMNLSDVSYDQQAPRETSPIEYTNKKIANVFKAKYPSAYYVGARSIYQRTPGGSGSQGVLNQYWFVVNYSDYIASTPQNPYVKIQYAWASISSSGNQGIWNFTDARASAVDYTWIMLDEALKIINNDEVSFDGKTKTSVYNSIITFINNYNNQHSAKVSNQIAWPAVTGATGYYIYRRSPNQGADRNFYRLGTTTATNYTDTDVNTTTVTGTTPIQGSIAFLNADNYPNLVSFYQQRLVIGCTKTKPTTIFGSRTGIYTDFTINATDPSSAYEFKMASKTSNPLEAILPLYTLAILTSGGDFISTVTGAMNASNVNFNQKSYNGCSGVPPIIVGDNGLYVPISQQAISSMSYSYEKDGFAHENIMFHAQFLAKNKRIIGIAHQRDPINLIWAVLDDGSLISSTYIPQQDFNAWTRHTTAGKVKSICVVPTTEGRDDLYMVVERTLGDGSKRQYLEVLEDMRPYTATPDAQNSFYVDCGLTGEFDTPVTTVTGLEHLEGLQVAILADNSVQDMQTVVNGSIKLEVPASVIHVGLPYEFLLETLNFDLVDQTLRDTRANIASLVVQVEDTRELWWRSGGGEKNSLIVHDYYEPGMPKLRNGDFEILSAAAMTRNAYLTFTSSDPVPCTVLSLVMEIDHGDNGQ